MILLPSLCVVDGSAAPSSVGRRRIATDTVRALVVATVLGAAQAGAALPLAAQPVTERTPNLQGTWITSPRNLFFSFSHRFQVVGQDVDVTDVFGDGKVVNYPTFDLAYGVVPDVMAGVRYSTNSLIARSSNEWQPYLKWAPIRGAAGGALSASLTGAWNGGTQSADGEITLQARAGRWIAIGALRGFTGVFDLPADRSDEAAALAGGLGFRLNRYVTLAADAADLVAGVDAPAAWSAGVEIGIPYTPHTLSLIATNVTSGTLEGTSTGVTGTVFWGFEFTIPFSGFARWGRILHPGEKGGSAGQAGKAATEPNAEGVVEIDIRNFAFRPAQLRVRPGTTVRWVNHDPVAHSSTSDTKAWESPLIGPGETYERTFRKPGSYPYHCTPHPFMTGVVEVAG